MKVSGGRNLDFSKNVPAHIHAWLKGNKGAGEVALDRTRALAGLLGKYDHLVRCEHLKVTYYYDEGDESEYDDMGMDRETTSPLVSSVVLHLFHSFRVYFSCGHGFRVVHHI